MFSIGLAYLIIKRRAIALCFPFLIMVLSHDVYANPASPTLHKIDSLQKLVESAPNDSVRLLQFTYMARQYRFLDIHKSKHYLRSAISELKQAGLNNESMSLAYNVLADIYIQEQKRDSAYLYFEEAYQRFLNLNRVEEYLDIAPMYGNFLVLNGDPERGLNILQDALVRAEENKDYENLSFIYLYLADVYLNVQKDRDNALRIYLVGLEASKKLEKNKRYYWLSTHYNLRLAGIYLEDKLYQVAIEMSETALEHAEATNIVNQKIKAYNIITECSIGLQQLAQAKLANDSAIKLQVSNQNNIEYIESSALRQDLYLIDKDYRNCIATGELILANQYGLMDSKIKTDVYANLCDCYLLTGDISKGIHAKDSLMYYTNIHLNTDHEDLLAATYSKFQETRHEVENKLLKTQKMAADEQLRTQGLAAIGLMSALLLMGLLAVAIYRISRQRKIYNRQLKNLVNERTMDLQMANAGLEKKNDDLRTMSFIASHDLKEPIRSIGNYIGLIRRRLNKEQQERFAEEFEIIKGSTTYLYTLIEDLTTYLSFSKTERGSHKDIDLNTLVRDVSRELKLQESYRNAEVTYADLPLIHTNRSAVYLVFKNIIENGLKYNESEVPMVNVSCRELNDRLEFVIEDNGIGISEDYRDKVFEMFKRLHNRSEYKGTGMGLAIVKLLLEGLDGEVSIETGQTGGTQFILSFSSALLSRSPLSESALLMTVS